MCDRYSDDYGYICDECFEELVTRGPVDIDGFMNTKKRGEMASGASRAYYEKIFVNPHRDYGEG